MFNRINFKKFAASADWIKSELENSIQSQASKKNEVEKDSTLNSDNYSANISFEDRESGKYDSILNNSQEFNKDILSDAENKSNVVNDLNKKISILESSGKKNKANALRMAVGKISDPLVTSDLNKFTRDVAKQTSIVH